jgi:hypothetical protein
VIHNQEIRNLCRRLHPGTTSARAAPNFFYAAFRMDLVRITFARPLHTGVLGFCERQKRFSDSRTFLLGIL